MKNNKSNKPAAARAIENLKANKATHAAKPVETPKQSLALFESLRPSLKSDTLNWIYGDVNGATVFAARVAEPRIIAVCTLNKATALPKTKEGKIDVEKLKVWRKSFNKCTPEKRASLEAGAVPTFKAALHDYLAAVKPIRAKLQGEAFNVRSLRVNIAKKTGNVSATVRFLAQAGDIK